MNKIWLVSALISKPEIRGHRAQILFCETEEEAIGIITKEETKNGYVIESIAATDTTNFVTKLVKELE